MRSIFLHPSIEVLVCSAGGVGTTFLMEEIGKYATVNDPSNKDGYKHMPIPPIPRNNKTKAIYVTGDPVMAAVSLFRRNYAHISSAHNFFYFPDSFLISEAMELEEYAGVQKDGFGFARNLKNWHSEFPMYPTMFVKYNAIHDSLEAIRNWLDLPEAFVENFPAKKERASRQLVLDENTIAGLTELYGDFQAELAGKSDYFYNATKKPIRVSTKYLAKAYLIGMRDHFYKRFPMVRKAIQKISYKR